MYYRSHKWNHWNHVRAVRFPCSYIISPQFSSSRVINHDYSRNIQGSSTPCTRDDLFRVGFLREITGAELVELPDRKYRISGRAHRWLHSTRLPRRFFDDGSRRSSRDKRTCRQFTKGSLYCVSLCSESFYAFVHSMIHKMSVFECRCRMRRLNFHSHLWRAVKN